MPQALLPLIPDGATPINDRISVARQDGQWIYFCGIAPVFQHAEDDHRSFRMFTAQLCCQDACKQAEIIRTFGVSKNSVLRSVKKYQEEGNAGFFQPRRGRGPSIITEKVVAEAERLLALGYDRRQTAQALNVPYETLRKAIQQGRVREPGAAEQTSPSSPASPAAAAATDKSTRSDADAAAGKRWALPAPGLANV